MIVDTSAIVAVLRMEAEAEEFARLLVQADSVSMSAASYVELGVVIDALDDPVLSREVDRIVTATAIEIAPVTATQAGLARAAYRDFGRGRGHRASLNFGDCFAYALAIERDEPLLFKGDDFGHTDVAVAAPR